MLIALHKNATTTPSTRRALQRATGSEYQMAERYGIGRGTVRKWRARDDVHDASHTPHRLQTTLNAGQEELVVYLRAQLRLPIDDLLAVIHEFIEPAMSRSALARLMRRREVSTLPEPQVQPRATKPFKAYEPGYVHIDVKYLPQMQDESTRGYVYVAIDRATRWVFISIKRQRNAASARSFLNELSKAAAFKIKTILTDNGTEFTDRLFGSRAKQPSGEHEFDKLCHTLDIEHRLTKPKTPQTNGMVERFNGRIEQVLRTHRFKQSEDLAATLHRYVWLYNEHLPQKALEHVAPVDSMKRWQTSHPHLFVRQVRNHPAPDTPSSVPCRARCRRPSAPPRTAIPTCTTS
jgi:transposase InsO family protein